MKKKQIHLSIIIFFLGILAYFGVVNFLYPPVADDFYFASATLHAQNILDLINKAALGTIQSYFNWSGRIFHYFFQYLFLSSFKVFNVTNAIISCFFIYAAFLIIKLRSPRSFFDVFTLLAICIAFWVFVFGFAETFLWKSGSFYVWVLTGTLFLLYPFLKFLENEDILSGKHPNSCMRFLKLGFLTVAAFILSTGMEILSLAVTATFIICSIYYWRANKRLPLAAKTITIAYIAGSILLIAAPGNYVRAAVLTHGGHAKYPTVFSKFIYFNLKLLNHFFTGRGHVILPLVVLGALALLVLWLLQKNQHPLPSKRIRVLLFLAAVSAYTLIGAPGVFINGRSIFCAEIFFILAMLIIITELDSLKKWQKAYAAIISLAFIALMPNMIQNFKDIWYLHKQFVFREYVIKLYKANNNEDVILPAYYIPSLGWNTYDKKSIDKQHLLLFDISDSGNEWVAPAVMSFYELKSVKLRPYAPE